MTAPGRPLPGCPARRGHGTDIRAAAFTLTVRDCPGSPGTQAATTAVSGIFGPPEQGQDVVVTASISLPAGSPPATLAHQVSADQYCTQRAADLLRSRIISCPCTTPASCPALTPASLLAALDYAAGGSAITAAIPQPAARPERTQVMPDRPSTITLSTITRSAVPAGPALAAPVSRVVPLALAARGLAEHLSPARPDAFLPEIEELLAIAAREITAHADDHGRCAVCGSAFPCLRAGLAGFTLACLAPASPPRAEAARP